MSWLCQIRMAPQTGRTQSSPAQVHSMLLTMLTLCRQIGIEIPSVLTMLLNTNFTMLTLCRRLGIENTRCIHCIDNVNTGANVRRSSHLLLLTLYADDE